MELGDYRTWRAVLPNRSHLLLDSETELPAAETLESEDGPLARIAAAIHANGSKLAPEDCEQVVRWIQYGDFDGGQFKVYSVLEFGKAVHYWRGGT